jgi:hypothetical protein
MTAGIYSESKTHQSNILLAEGVRQVAVATAAGSGATLQANVRAAELVYARAGLKSAIQNSCETSSWTMLLLSLGVQT